jgi:tellurium resistance protein TerD
MSENTKDAEATTVNLSRNSAGLRKLLIGAGWSFGTHNKHEVMDIDLCCFILGRDNLTREDHDFIFYNNPQGAQLAVKHLGDNRVNINEADNEAIMVDLDAMSFDVWRIIFVASIYQGHEHDQNFSDLKEMVIRAENYDSGAEIARFTLTGDKMGDAAAIKIAEIYREGVEWYFHYMGEPVTKGLSEIAKGYGLLISSTT